jgi:hypothetical protein
MIGMLLQLTIAGLIGWGVIFLSLWITRGMEYEQVDTSDLELWRLLAERPASGRNEERVIHHAEWKADRAQTCATNDSRSTSDRRSPRQRDGERDEIECAMIELGGKMMFIEK